MREKPGEEWEAGRRIRRERGDGREQEGGETETEGGVRHTHTRTHVQNIKLLMNAREERLRVKAAVCAELPGTSSTHINVCDV